MLALYAPAIFFDGQLQKSVLDVFFVCLMLLIVATVVSAELAETAETAERAEAAEKNGRWWALGLTMGGLALTRENALRVRAVVLVWALVEPSFDVGL